MKIASAIERAFRASMNIEGQTPEEVVNSVNLLTNKVVARATQLSREGTELHVELIQDEVERQMMAEGFYQVAKDIILYRAQRAAQRALEGEQPEVSAQEATVAPAAVVTSPGVTFKATSSEGKILSITEGELRARIQHACRGLEKLASSEDILQESIKNFYEGIKIEEVDQANIMAARAKIEKDPAYSFVAARLLLDIIYRETMKVDAHSKDLEKAHQE
jgi:ribonucleoside-diphosphate reductase alpha chain